MKYPVALLAAVSVLGLSSHMAHAQATAAAPAAPATPPAATPAPAATATPPAAPAVPAAFAIDPKILSLADSVQAKLKSLKSFSAEAFTVMAYTMPGSAKNPAPTHQITDVKLMHPNYCSISTWDQTLSPADNKWHRSKQNIIRDSDGKNVWMWVADQNAYMKSPADPSGANIPVALQGGVGGFFLNQQSISTELNNLNSAHVLTSAVLKENQAWNNANYSVIEYAYTVNLPAQMAKNFPDGKVTITKDVYIGDDLVPHRLTVSSSIVNADFTYDPLKLDLPIATSAFAFTPPAGATLQSPEAQAPPLIKNGVMAPDFTVQNPEGKSVKLSDYRGKVVVIDFWATWCGPCQASLPHTNEVAAGFKDKDVVFLAINTWDTQDAFKAWLPDHKDFSSLVFLIDPSSGPKNIAQSLYKVSGIPTQFVIDKTGKIANSFVGYGGPTDDLKNAVVAAGG